MSRRSLLVTGFQKGISLRADALTKGDFTRLTGFKIGSRLGSLESRGGFSDYDLGTNLLNIQGFKRWYRSDGAKIDLMVAYSGTQESILQVKLETKTAASLGVLTDIINYDEPLQWIDCNDQLILVFGGATARATSLKSSEAESVSGDYGLRVTSLGLDPPTNPPEVTVSAAITSDIGVDLPIRVIQPGKYLYYYSYVYGTPSEPTKYGETELSPAGEANILLYGFGRANWYINQITVPALSATGMIRKIIIYRTLADASTPYKIGEITEPGRTIFNDCIPDDFVDTSQTPQTLYGLPTAMVCGVWHNVIQRLLWFGSDGYFHWSSATYPDINPPAQKMVVGHLEYQGKAIVIIRNNIFAFKEDGIFLISGDAPNYTSKPVSPVGVVSGLTVVDMPDGYYFLGYESKELKVYRFDGNNAVPISTPIEALFSRNHPGILRQVFAKRVGSEYWLSIPSKDTRYAVWPLPYNNIIIPFDSRYGVWGGPFQCQAGTIEVFDGPDDKGEVFITESDPTSDVNKGDLFKLNPNINTANITYYSGGSRAYTKAYPVTRVITMGVCPGVGQKDNPGLETIVGYTLQARVRGLEGSAPRFKAFDDSGDLANPEANSTLVEPLLQYASLSASQKFGTTYGTGRYIVNYVDDALHNFDLSEQYTGLYLEISFTLNNYRKLQVEAINGTYGTTENE